MTTLERDEGTLRITQRTREQEGKQQQRTASDSDQHSTELKFDVSRVMRTTNNSDVPNSEARTNPESATCNYNRETVESVERSARDATTASTTFRALAFLQAGRGGEATVSRSGAACCRFVPCRTSAKSVSSVASEWPGQLAVPLWSGVRSRPGSHQAAGPPSSLSSRQPVGVRFLPEPAVETLHVRR